MNESKFSGMGNIYAQYRPAYPQEFINYIFSAVGMAKSSSIADIGSGTGILTKQLLERGCSVFAVEPNADMRATAEAALSHYGSFISVDGSAEHTTLENNSVDFITVAQAFHWFDKRRFKEECKRIVRPNGKTVLVWNDRDTSSDLVRENETIIRKYCPEFKGYSGGMDFSGGGDDFHDFFDGDYESMVFRNDLDFDEQGFIGRNLSGSYAPKEGDDQYDAYVDALRALFIKYSINGLLKLPNKTYSFAGVIRCD